MEITWIVLRAVLTVTPLLVGVHMLVASAEWPEFLERMNRPTWREEPVTGKALRMAYLALAYVGYVSLVFAGIDSLLAWIPDDVGHMQEGDWLPLRQAVAITAALVIGLGVPAALLRLAEHNARMSRAE